MPRCAPQYNLSCTKCRQGAKIYPNFESRPRPQCSKNSYFAMVRFKNRWLLVHIDFDKEDVPARDGETIGGAATKASTVAGGTPMQLLLLRTIRDLIQQHFGDVGAGALGGSLAVRYYSAQTNHAIVRCARLGVQHVWAAMTMCTHLGGRRARLLVTHCGGTIRKVQQAAIRRDYMIIAKQQSTQRTSLMAMADSDTEQQQVENDVAEESTNAASKKPTLGTEAEAVHAQNKKAIMSIRF